MAHESFENTEVARVLNAYFISIKVDREERPDIDQVYMTACQGMTGSGGWPLTVILDTEQRPFFAGTYFTPARLMEILEQVVSAWISRREELNHFAERLTSVMRAQESSFSAEVDHGAIHEAYRQLKRRYDPQYGGFSAAPKFPTPHLLLFLLRYARIKNESEAKQMAFQTLRCMAQGGLQDQIGFGFSRYSTDSRWLVPHFEKMLYDNALLTLAYLEAARLAEPKEVVAFESTASKILEYLLRDMQDSQGGFYTAEDADSEGEEGLFYLWTPEEVCDVLGKDTGQLVANLLDIRTSGNFEGRSIPNFIDKRLTTAEQDLLHAVRPKLFLARERRPRPARDDKILVSQNGLAIAALARAGVALGETTYLQEASRAAVFILNELSATEGCLCSRYVKGEARYPAHAEDYAFFIWGLLELYHADGDLSWLARAQSFARILLRDFQDSSLGGFYLSSSRAEQLIVRQKPSYDAAYPSANSVAADVLQRLGVLLNDEEMIETAAATRRAFAAEIATNPTAYTWMLSSLLEADNLSKVVLVGSSPGVLGEFRELLRIEAPEVLVLQRTEHQEIPTALQAAFAGYSLQQGKVTAYLCHGKTCYPPQSEVTGLRNLLSKHQQ